MNLFQDFQFNYDKVMLMQCEADGKMQVILFSPAGPTAHIDETSFAVLEVVLPKEERLWL
ncbi:MAG TPA: hypothetical protein VJ734_06600 [Nitrosospira sp.]|nr:hypothetical protein [Nitrosospira sp.]